MNDSFKYVSANEALNLIQSNQRVFVHGSACTPLHLLSTLAEQKDRLQNVEIVCITLQGDIKIDKPCCQNAFHINTMFVSSSTRQAVTEGRADFIPVFLSEIPDLFNKNILSIDVALVQVSPPDQHGYCSLGLSVDIARSAVNNAKTVIAQVNPRMPRTQGDGWIHIDKIAAMVWHEEDLPEVNYAARTGAEELEIGRLVAGLIEDGSTIQVGVGTIPDAVLKSLVHHKDMGIHTEMCSDGIIELVEKGVINNSKKRIHPYKSVTSFALGTKNLYKYLDNHQGFVFLDIDYVNDPHVIRRNPKVAAINCAIEVDLTGQVCADSIGNMQYSGIGGQMDFMRGAALSEGGKPVITLTSRTKKGLPRIVPYLKEGAGVVTTRGHVHYIVTEYGVAYLYGKNLRQRARALINIAHPNDREMLTQKCHERFKIFL